MRFLIAIVLLFSITPGMSEVFELAAHIVAHADLPHHDETSQDCSEHTCTPMAHHCGCHASMSARASSQLATTRSVTNITELYVAAIVSARGRVAEPPPIRPPIV